MNWNDELRKNITGIDDLIQDPGLSEEDACLLQPILQQFPMSIPSYYFSLIDWNDPDDPVRKMAVPSLEELDLHGTFDPSNEASNTVIQGIQHKYEPTAMILSTQRCAMYCRHCFRKRLVGREARKESVKSPETAAEYVKKHPEINNVLISGGDSLLNDNKVIRKYLELFSGMDQLDLIRFGTRVPVVFPSRIYEDEVLLQMLEEYNQVKQIYVVTQFDHPREITPESIRAVRELVRRGIVVKNQTVLMRDVNDSEEILCDLLRKLTAIGAIPYYIFQCRPVAGLGHRFQVPLLKGIRVVDAARSRQSGQGKCVKYVMSHHSGKIEIVGMLDESRLVMKYNNSKYPANSNRVFVIEPKEDQCWLED